MLTSLKTYDTTLMFGCLKNEIFSQWWLIWGYCCNQDQILKNPYDFAKLLLCILGLFPYWSSVDNTPHLIRCYCCSVVVINSCHVRIHSQYQQNHKLSSSPPPKITEVTHDDYVCDVSLIGHGISSNTQSKSYMPSLTEFVCNFKNNALWDTH